MLSKLFFVINFFILTIVLALKTYYEGSFEWFYALPWLTFLNGFIDIAIKSQVSSNTILTFWLLITIIWLFFLIKLIKFEQRNKNKTIDLKNKPLDIDDLDEKHAFEELNSSQSDNSEKITSNPESIGANFAAALSQAVSINEGIDKQRNSNSSFFDQANQALSSMTPEAAQKLRKVQTVLSNLEATAKSEDLDKLNKKNMKY